VVLAEVTKIAPGAAAEVSARRRREQSTPLHFACGDRRRRVMRGGARRAEHGRVRRDDDHIAVANGTRIKATTPLGDRVDVEPFRPPSRLFGFRLRTVIESPGPVLATATFLLPDGAVEEDEKCGHHAVVASGLGPFEQALDQRLVTVGVQRQIEIVEEELAGDRPRVGEPARGEIAQTVGVGHAAEFVHEPGVAALEQFFRDGPGAGRRCSHAFVSASDDSGSRGGRQCS